MRKPLEEKYRPLMPEGLTLRSIAQVNHNPHRFTVGPSHVAYAYDHNGGILSEDVCCHAPCAVCYRPFDEHTYNTVMFLPLTRSLTLDEVRIKLQFLTYAGMEEDKIDGFAFVETPEKFRIGE